MSLAEALLLQEDEMPDSLSRGLTWKRIGNNSATEL